METRLSLAPGQNGTKKTELPERIKAAGGIWRPRHKVWEIDWKTVRELGLHERVVVEEPG